MIEHLIITYLGKDSTLIALLSSTTAIYFGEAPEENDTPYIVVNSSVGGLDETIDEDRIEVKVVANTFPNLKSIRDRLKVLLDVDNSIRTTASDSTHRLYYSKLSGSSGVYFDPGTDEPIDNLFFAVKYKKL